MSSVSILNQLQHNIMPISSLAAIWTPPQMTMESSTGRINIFYCFKQWVCSCFILHKYCYKNTYISKICYHKTPYSKRRYVRSHVTSFFVHRLGITDCNKLKITNLGQPSMHNTHATFHMSCASQ
jgi:hypothetical protein